MMTDDAANEYVEKVKSVLPEFNAFLMFCVNHDGGFWYIDTVDDSAAKLGSVIYDSLNGTPGLLRIFRDVISRIDAENGNEINLN